MADTVVPTAPHELEEWLNDPGKREEIFKDPAKLRDFMTNYTRAVTAKDAGLQQQIREQTQLALAELLKDNRDARPDVPIPLNMNPVDGVPGQFTNRATRRATLRNSRAPGARADKVFTDATEYFQAIWHNHEVLPNRDDLNAKLTELRKIQNSFGSEVPADGGFLIPEVMRSELLSIALESAVVRPRATVIPMSSLRVPIPAVDDTDHSANVFGGIIGYWTEESAGLTESQAKFQQVVLDAKKLTIFCKAPNELIADGPAFMSFLDARLPQAISWYEDVAFFSGTGAGEPLGFNNASALVAVAARPTQATKTIVWQNIADMYSRMLPQSLGNAVWIANLDTFPELATMALSVGTGGSAIWINNGALGPPVTILGRPVLFTEKAATLGTQGDLSFVDLSYYLLGDRQAMRAESSQHYAFANDQTAFRVIERVDGRPWINSAITPRSGSANTLSPFVQLATR